MIWKFFIKCNKRSYGYRQLNSGKIIKTIAILKHRIEERFPQANLIQVCDELLNIAQESQEKIIWIEKPNYIVRFIMSFLFICLLFFSLYYFPIIEMPKKSWQLNEFVQSLDAITGVFIALFFLVYFFISFENRLKRERAIEALHELRAISHVIDMHQLIKDPSKFIILNNNTFIDMIEPTQSSPKLMMNPKSLIRYLHYCTELLSLTGKIAALYGQKLEDATIIRNINDIEELTTSLSQKIWQKIIILKGSV